ncbi:MAG TPA: type IV pilus modification protein PilV [Gammaproteobacteria bacterium]
MNRHATHRKASGFSLIEVLIALVILSVGLLGIAAMVSVSLKSKDSSYYQTQATTLAQAMLDRMRANHATATSGGYDLDIAAADPTAAACVGSAVTCSGTEIASFDLADWRANLANTLPDGKGGIATVAVAQFTQVTITITWNDQRANRALGGDAASDTATYTLTSGL